MALSEKTKSLLKQAFRPHTPIEDPDSFVGREKERDQVVEAVEEPGLQVVIFGERGAGKTSLANIGTSGVQRVRVFCERDVTFNTLCQHIALEYQKLVPKRVVYDAQADVLKVEGTVLPLNKLTGNTLRRILPTDGPFCIVLDELDRVTDKAVVAKVAELAKNISTYQNNLTMVLVGVAGTADELLAGHASNFRNLRQVSLDRMTSPELLDIIKRGERVLGLKFSESVRSRIVELSDRFPYYLHLLATGAARAALIRDSVAVQDRDLVAGIKAAATDADQSLRKTYDDAVLSVKRSEIYRQILWGLASLPGASHTVAEIAEAANSIAVQEGGTEVTVQAIGQALKKLVTDERRKILIPRAGGIYSFSNPLMKGFVRLLREQS